MTYKELLEKIAETTSYPQAKVDEVLDAFKQEVRAELVDGSEVRLPDLGTFSTATRAARKGRNPSTGEPMDIAATRVVKFSPAGSLKAAVKA